MSVPTIETYTRRYHDAIHIQENSYWACVAAAVVGIAIGVMGTIAFYGGLLPFSFGNIGNIVISVGAGALVASFAIIGIKIYYEKKIYETKELCNHATLFEVLISESAKNFSNNTVPAFSALEFRNVLSSISDQQWEILMAQCDYQFFKAENRPYPDAIKWQAFEVLLKANPSRFMQQFITMGDAEKLSKEAVTFISARIAPAVAALDPESRSALLSEESVYQEILQQFDKHYFSNNQDYALGNSPFKPIILEVTDFLINYHVLKANGEISPAGQTHLDAIVATKLNELNAPTWQRLFVEIDRLYFKKNYKKFLAVSGSLLNAMSIQNPTKFINAYLHFGDHAHFSSHFRKSIELILPGILKDADLQQINQTFHTRKDQKLLSKSLVRCIETAKPEMRKRKVPKFYSEEKWRKQLKQFDKAYKHTSEAKFDDAVEEAKLLIHNGGKIENCVKAFSTQKLSATTIDILNNAFVEFLAELPLAQLSALHPMANEAVQLALAEKKKNNTVAFDEEAANLLKQTDIDPGFRSVVICARTRQSQSLVGALLQKHPDDE